TDHEHACVDTSRHDPLDQIDAVSISQRDIHNHEPGPGRYDHFHSRFNVVCFAANFHVGLRGNACGQPLTHVRGIIHDGDGAAAARSRRVAFLKACWAMRYGWLDSLSLSSSTVDGHSHPHGIPCISVVCPATSASAVMSPSRSIVTGTMPRASERTR